MSFPLGFSTLLPPEQTPQGGFARPVSAYDIRLTAQSARVQSFNLSAAANIYLPNGTDLPVSGFQFILSAEPGSSTGTLRDGAGNAVTTIAAKGAVICSFTNNGTPAGIWSVKAFASITELIAGTATVGNALSTTYISTCALTSTTALIAYNDGTNLSTVVVTATTGSVAFGSPVTAAPAPLYVSVSKLSATQAICTFRNGGTTFLNAVIINVSGTTPSFGVILAVNAAASTYTSVAALSATQAICSWVDTSLVKYCTLNVSGSTITAGAAASSGANGTYTAVAALSATLAVGTFNNTTTGTSSALFTLTISGTTVTIPGGSASFNSIVTSYNSLFALSATKFIWGYAGASNYLNAQVVDVSGTTPTGATAVTINAATSTYIAIAFLNSTTAICTYYETALKYVVLSIATSAITAGTPTSFSTTVVSAAYNSICILTGTNRMVDAYAGTSNYLQAQELEYTVSV